MSLHRQNDIHVNSTKNGSKFIFYTLPAICHCIHYVFKNKYSSAYKTELKRIS